ncbi:MULTISPECIES: hypothetical protein [Streptomyces]|uniref:HTH tetR-type domain-containing protein n=2 Tax=Streptomyces TaxID=1883 RepID=A0ABV9IYA8_9ACTN
MTTVPDPTRSRPTRGDTERDHRHLTKAEARLFENSPAPVNLAEIAKHAEVSTATACRRH